MMKTKLHRKIQAPTNSVFSLTIGEYNISDSQIYSLSITRGLSGFSYGVQPAVAEARVRGLYPTLFHKEMRIKITDPAAEHISKRTGVSASLIADRFTGCVGVQNAIDTGKPARNKSEISASSYSSILKPSDLKQNISDRSNVRTILINAFSKSVISDLVEVVDTPKDSKYWDLAHIENGSQELKFSETIGKFASDLMTLCVEKRNGKIQIKPALYRHDEIKSRANDYAPLRSNALAGAEYTQPVGQRSASYLQKETLEDGRYRERIWPAYSKDYSYDMPIESAEIDFTHIYRMSETSDTVVRAKMFQNNWPRLNASKIKFDLLHLLSSGREYDRRLAGHLLKLEHGDPIYFSRDWTYANPGVLIAQQIKETIDYKTWEIEINLEHPMMLLAAGTQIPAPIVWEQALNTWASEERPWGGI